MTKLSNQAQALYAEVTSEFDLGQHDLMTLLMACHAWDRYQQARDAIADHGLVAKTHEGSVKTNPAVAIERDCRTQFLALIKALSLDSEAPALQTALRAVS